MLAPTLANSERPARDGGEWNTAGTRSPMVLSGLVCAGANVEGTPNRGDDTAEEGSEGEGQPGPGVGGVRPLWDGGLKRCPLSVAPRSG